MASRLIAFTPWFIETMDLPGKRGKTRRDWMRMPIALAVWVVFLLVFGTYLISCSWFVIPFCFFLRWRSHRRRQRFLRGLSQQGRLLNWVDVSGRVQAGDGSLLILWPAEDWLWWVPAPPARVSAGLTCLVDRGWYMAIGPRAAALRDDLIGPENGPACLVQEPEEPPRTTELVFLPDYYRQRFPTADIIFLAPDIGCATAQHRT
jgi:hypothetical protein